MQFEFPVCLCMCVLCGHDCKRTEKRFEIDPVAMKYHFILRRLGVFALLISFKCSGFYHV